MSTIPAHPLLRAAGHPLPRGQAGSLSPIAGDARTGGGVVRCADGLPGSLSAPDRRAALRTRPDGAHRILPGGNLAARPTGGYFMNTNPAVISNAARLASRSEGGPFACPRISLVRISGHAHLAWSLHAPQPPVPRCKLKKAQFWLQFAPASRTCVSRSDKSVLIQFP